MPSSFIDLCALIIYSWYSITTWNYSIVALLLELVVDCVVL